MIVKKFIDILFFLHSRVNKGALLFISAILAVIVSNSKFSYLYYSLIGQDLSLSLGSSTFSFSLHQWTNEFLMAIFFLVVGMEIKKEMVVGSLKSRSQRIVPIIAACFGVIFPILIYIFFNYQDKVAMKAWAIPAATDIAFALGVFTIFNKNIPPTLRLLLIAIAVIDDLIAIVIIAFFYTRALHLEYFIPIIVCCISLYLLNRVKVFSMAIYLIIGVFMWYCFLRSGIHSTISGVVLSIFIPLKISNDHFPVKKIEKLLLPYVEYLILPLFVFVNSGISLTLMNFNSLLHPVVLGIALGLFVGKAFGIFVPIYIFKALKIITLQDDIKVKHYGYISILCGIGYTMSLFVGLIAFEHNVLYLELAKTGIIAGSILSSIVVITLMKIFK